MKTEKSYHESLAVGPDALSCLAFRIPQVVSRRDGTFFPCGMFLHCAPNADYCICQRERELVRECSFSARCRLSPLVRGNPDGRLAQGNGRGSRMATQVCLASQLLL